MSSAALRIRILSTDMASALRVRAGAGLRRVWLPLLIVYVVWGSTYLGIRLAIDTIPPLLMAGLRFSVAGTILYLFSIRRGESTRDRPGRVQWTAAFLIGALLLFGGNGGVVLAERSIPSGIAALLVATVPLWMAIIDSAFFGHRLNRLTVVGLLVGFGGVALLLGWQGGHIDPRGAILGLLAPVCWASGSVFSRRARLPMRPMVATAMQMLCGGALFLVAGVAAGEPGRVHLSAISTTSLLALAYLTVFGSLVAFSAYVYLLRSAPLTLVSTYAYVNPVVAVALGAVVLGEDISVRTLVAGGVIVGAIALIVSARFTPAKPQPARRAAPAHP